MSDLEEAGIYDIIQDEHFRELAKIVEQDSITSILTKLDKLIQQPSLSPAKATALVVQCEAAALKCAAAASLYKYAGTAGDKQARQQKDAYYSLKEGLRRLADALKYMAKI